MPSSATVPFASTVQVRDSCLCLHTQRAARALARRFDQALKPSGLTNEQFSLLMALNRPQAPAMNQVAALLGADRTTLTAALKPLTRRGLALIEADPADSRVRRVSLTAEGHACLTAALPAWTQTHQQVEAELDADPNQLRRDLNCLASPKGANPTPSICLQEETRQ
jgi:DNA-binding MarR family transcriptional regulator